MIVFVLQDSRQKPVDDFVDGFSAGIVGRDPDAAGACDLGVHGRQAQAALVRFVPTFGGGNDGVDEHPLLAFARFARRVDHKQLQWQIDLIRRQSDAVVLVHQLEHSANDRLQFAIDAANGFGWVSERRVWIKDDFQSYLPGGGKSQDYIEGVPRGWRPTDWGVADGAEHVKCGIRVCDKSIPDSMGNHRKKNFASAETAPHGNEPFFCERCVTGKVRRLAKKFF
jgi:hypothetical protein